VSPQAIDVYVVDHAVHLRDGVVLGPELLASQLERDFAWGVEFVGDELPLDQQAGGATGVVVAALAGTRAHDVRQKIGRALR
jgi:hypothetical protein